MLVPYPLRQTIPELGEKVLLRLDRLEPLGGIDAKEHLEGRIAEIEPGAIEGARLRDPPDRRLARLAASIASIEDPPEHAEVLAEAGPQEPAIVARPEPVHPKDFRRVGHPTPHIQPVC